MTAYELAERKMSIVNLLRSLYKEERESKTDSILISSLEVSKITQTLEFCVSMIDDTLRSTVITKENN